MSDDVRPAGVAGALAARGFGPADYGCLILLAALWGGSFMLIKTALPTMGPFTIVVSRLALGAAALYAVLKLRGLRLPARAADWLPFVVFGAIGNLAPFTLIAWGQQHVPSAVAAILMAAMPLFTLVLARVAKPAENPITAGRVGGIALGFSGVVVLVGPSALTEAGGGIGELAILGAALCYAVASLYAERVRHVPPLVSATATLTSGAVLALPVAAILEQPWTQAPALEAMAAVTLLGIACTGLAYLLFYRLMARGGAVLVALNNYLIPAFGVMWGILLLGEQPSLNAFLALGLILSAITVANRRRR